MMSKYILKIFLIYFFITNLAKLEANEEGYASWYAGKFQGRKTASGEIFDTTKFTAAHRTLPFGTLVKVTNLENGKEVVVRINDRGPFVEKRIIDLSQAAAFELDILKRGLARVSLTIIGNYEPNSFYRLQVASFLKKENALKTKDLLKEKGFTVFLEETETGSIRVWLDNIPQKELPLTKNILNELGFSNYLLKKIKRS